MKLGRLARGVLLLALALSSISFNVPTASAIGSGNCVSTTTGVTATAAQSGSTCTVTFTAGTGTWTLPSGTYTVTYLVVGGGGSGSRGTCSSTYGPGGGGGAVVTGNTSLTGSVTVTVGSGGATLVGSCPNTAGNAGNTSRLATVTANGGEGAGAGRIGGASGNGNAGGTAPASGCGECYAGGGGGAGGVGGAGGINSSMNGGAGVASSITGTSVAYGGGGGGRSSSYYGTATAGGGAGNGTCTGTANTGGGGADCISNGGAGGSGIVVAVYTYNQPPVIGAFSGADTASYSVNEGVQSLYNLNATDADAGTTLTYSLTGTDASDFTISSSGGLAFAFIPDFEDAQDSDRNNIYIVITWVSDGQVSDSQTATITVNNLNENGTITSPSLSRVPKKGETVTATVTVNAPGKVQFRVNNKRIAGCINVSTSGSYPNYTASCIWKPTFTGRQNLTAVLTPTSNTFTSATSPSQWLWILKRSLSR